MGITEGEMVLGQRAFPPENHEKRTSHRHGRYIVNESFAYPWFAWYPVTIDCRDGKQRKVWFRWVWRVVRSHIGLTIIDSYQTIFHFDYNPDVAG